MAATLLATAAAPTTLVVLATQPGCALFGSPGPSTVGQGHKYVSGNPDYDAYFSQLYELQVQMAGAPDAEKKIRNKLAGKLGVDPDESASLLAHKVHKHAEKLAKQGISLEIKLSDDDASPPKLETSGALSSDAKSFADAVQDAVAHEAKLAAEMKKSHKVLDQLRGQTVDLKARVDTVFHKGGLGKRAEVKKNLKDADSIISLMTARADKVADEASHAAKRLAKAVHTGHIEVKPAEKPEHHPARRKPRWHPTHHAPGATHKPPPKKPASPPPSDFEP